MNAHRIIENINRKPNYKAQEQQKDFIYLDGQEQQKGNINKAKARTEQHQVVKK